MNRTSFTHRKMKVILVLLLCFVLVFSCVIPVGAEETNPREDNSLTELETLALEQSGALTAYFQLRELFKFVDYNKIVYPIGYGGCYINSDNFLVIKYKEGNTEFYENAKKAIDPVLPVQFIACTHSLLDFADLGRKIQDACAKNIIQYHFINQESGLLEYYLGEEDIPYFEALCELVSGDSFLNLPIKVTLVNDNTRIEEEFLNTENNNINSIDRSMTTSYAIGGQALYVKLQSTGVSQLCGSLGLCGSIYNASNNSLMYSNAYLTAGHVGALAYWSNIYNDYLYFSSGHTAEVYRLSYYYPTNNNPYVTNNGDYAIAKMTSDTSTNYVYTNSSTYAPIAAYYNNNDLPNNTLVYKYGTSTGLTVGKIKSNGNHSYPTDNSQTITIDGVVSVINILGDDYSVQSMLQPNDSGGPVWCVSNDNNTYSRIFLGTVSGHDSGWTEMYYSPVSHATHTVSENYAGASVYFLPNVNEWTTDNVVIYDN